MKRKGILLLSSLIPFRDLDFPSTLVEYLDFYNKTYWGKTCLFMDLFPLVKSWRPDLSCSSCSTDLVVVWHSSEILTPTHSFIFQESHGPFLAFQTTSGPPAYCYVYLSVHCNCHFIVHTPALLVPFLPQVPSCLLVQLSFTPFLVPSSGFSLPTKLSL